jgi:UDP-glucose 4-epimerase
VKILVTGGAGYIGSHTAFRLIEAGHQVVILDNLYSGSQSAVHESAKFVQGSIADSPLVTKIIKDHSIEAIVHFAAHIEVPESVSDPLKYYSNNTAGSLALIKAAFDCGVRKMIFSSTAAIYGNTETPLVSETAEIAPINPYGLSKWMTEQILRDLAATSQFKYVALRYFNVAGARADGKIGQSTPRATHLIKTAVEAATGKRSKMFIYGTDYPTPDGTGVRDYIYVEDLAQAHILALNHLEQGGESDVFNCGYGKGFSVRQVIDMVKKVSQVDFQVEEGPRRLGDSAMVVADSTKIRKKLAWAPEGDDLELICRTALNWEKKLTESRKSSL